MRKPFQGVVNIVRFNWPFYVLAALAGMILIGCTVYLRSPLNYLAAAFLAISGFLTLVSLLVSWYVYDRSGLYGLGWLEHLRVKAPKRVLNINAGFDETSDLLRELFSGAELTVFDFYDEVKHTSPSIKRARSAYAPFPGTQVISTANIPLDNDSVDTIFVIMSAHEIRSADERAAFFAELKRILTPEGQIVVLEHLRDMANFAAYNVGAFHFHSRESWLLSFDASQLRIETEIKITPFTTAFFLEKNGTTS